MPVKVGIAPDASVRSAAASGRLGVTTVANGKTQRALSRALRASTRVSPAAATMTGSMTRCGAPPTPAPVAITPPAGAPFADTRPARAYSMHAVASAVMCAFEGTMPVFTASTPRSESTDRTCAWKCACGTMCTSCTPFVFCAVRAVSAVIPKTPCAANAFKSACMPAPPPASEPAAVRQRGAGAISRAPQAIRFGKSAASNSRQPWWEVYTTRS